MKTSVIIFISILAAAMQSRAQQVFQDEIYLNNGSVLRGAITEQYADSLVKIQISGGSVLVVKVPDINHITYSVETDHGAIADANDAFAGQRQKGYFNSSSIGFMPGNNYTDYYFYYPANKTSIGFTIQTINGYRFNPHFTAGAGIGLDIIEFPMGQLFADGRWEILNRRATPFVFADGGYGIPLTKGQSDVNGKTTYRGGITAGAGIGIRINFRNEGAFIVEAGYKLDQRTEEMNYELWEINQTYKYQYNRLAIRFGVTF